MTFRKRVKLSQTEKLQQQCEHLVWENIPMQEQKRMPFLEAEQCKYQERCVDCGLRRPKIPTPYDRPKKPQGRTFLQ